MKEHNFVILGRTYTIYATYLSKCLLSSLLSTKSLLWFTWRVRRREAVDDSKLVGVGHDGGAVNIAEIPQTWGKGKINTDYE